MSEIRARAGTWHLSVSADEGGELLEANRGLVEGGASLIVSPDGDVQELVLFSREDEEERARQAAIDVYQQLRRIAGLDPQSARVISHERPSSRAKRDASDTGSTSR